MGIKYSKSIMNLKQKENKYKNADWINSYHLPEKDEDLLKECEIHVFRSSGPGGQSVNTTDSAVRLIHTPTGIKTESQRERSQFLNKKNALKKIREKIKEAQYIPEERIATAASEKERLDRLKKKKKVSSKKELRQWRGDYSEEE